MYPSTRGAFGRQARYRHGPLPVLRTAHPATEDFLQLASDSHKLNLLQYLFAPGVQAVLADRQLPQWVGTYVPKQVAHRAQVVELEGGNRLIVHLHRARTTENPAVARIQQLHPHLWLIERSSEHVEATPVLNRNLGLAGQMLKAHRDEDLSRHGEMVVEALRSGRRATLRQLTAYLQLRVGPDNDLATIVRVVLCRLLLAHRVSINLAECEWSDQTRLLWGGIGTGHIPPMPTGAGGFVCGGEAA